MDIREFRERGHELIDWMADYFENIEELPVKSQLEPKDVLNQLPLDPPEQQESFTEIFADFNNIIMPGMTHWQHPSFFAYFNANNSFPSILGEMLTSTLGAQCMIWQTSPAAAELEERVMEWIAKMIGLPEAFTGVIQDTASTATLCSILTAREKFSNYDVNTKGFYNKPIFTVYGSSEAHSSIDKAVKIAGLGIENLRKIAIDDQFAMKPEALEKAIIADQQKGLQPLAVIAAIGTTGSTAIDPLEAIADICQRHNVWLHVDAAYAGTALVISELRWMTKGIELADTFVFNPHKWMFTNFDCSAYYVKDQEALIRTFEILPEYLKTKEASRVNNYRDWGVQLGRRFRALKLWFVIRSFGTKGIQDKIASHLQWAKELEQQIEDSKDFELLAPVPLATVCFRYKPNNMDDLEKINRLNERLMEQLNASGKLYLTHTKLDGKYTLRMVIGQTNMEKRHVQQAWELIKTTAANI